MYERGSLPTDKIPAKKSLGHFSYPILGCHKIPFRDFSRRKLIFTKSHLILFQFFHGLTLHFRFFFLSHWTVIKWSNSQHKKVLLNGSNGNVSLLYMNHLEKKPFFCYAPLSNWGGSPTEWIWCNSLWCNWSMYATVSLKICTWKNKIKCLLKMDKVQFINVTKKGRFSGVVCFIQKFFTSFRFSRC